MGEGITEGFQLLVGRRQFLGALFQVAAQFGDLGLHPVEIRGQLADFVPGGHLQRRLEFPGSGHALDMAAQGLKQGQALFQGDIEQGIADDQNDQEHRQVDGDPAPDGGMQQGDVALGKEDAGGRAEGIPDRTHADQVALPAHLDLVQGEFPEPSGEGGAETGGQLHRQLAAGGIEHGEAAQVDGGQIDRILVKVVFLQQEADIVAGDCLHLFKDVADLLAELQVADQPAAAEHRHDAAQGKEILAHFQTTGKGPARGGLQVGGSFQDIPELARLVNAQQNRAVRRDEGQLVDLVGVFEGLEEGQGGALQRLPPRCHELGGDRVGQFSVDLDHPYRLLFIPADEPVPYREDGGIDLERVKEIEIIEIADTH